jgi:hypothetical protein
VCKRGDGRRGSEHAELDRDGRGVVKDRLELVSAHYASHIISSHIISYHLTSSSQLPSVDAMQNLKVEWRGGQAHLLNDKLGRDLMDSMHALCILRGQASDHARAIAPKRRYSLEIRLVLSLYARRSSQMGSPGYQLPHPSRYLPVSSSLDDFRQKAHPLW